MTFPEDFAWGAATSAYQIEGAVDAEGRGPSVWDVFCRRPAAVWGGHKGDTACDHYRRYAADVALMRQIGLRAYRLSIAWPRVLPGGVGEVNPRGLDFYDRLIDALLDADIVPYVTLFHWDLPQALEDRGGWLDRASADWFAEYTTVVARRLADRVTHWFTINEPQVFLSHGYQTGVHAPGKKLPRKQVLQMGHHVLLAHGKAVQALRAASEGPCEIGFAPVGTVFVPATNGPADVEAARQMMFTVHNDSLFNNTWWMDPPLLGRYPIDGIRRFGADSPEVQPGDLEIIHQPLDFFGHNTYSAQVVRMGAQGPECVPSAPGGAMSTFRWALEPEALYWGPRLFHERYGLPIHVAENGMSNTDWVALDGKVHDPQRIDYMARYLRKLEEALQDGVDVRGYFYWSILDNFEWAEGYRERFGLVHVDFATQARTLKDSAYWYRHVIAGGGDALFDPRPTPAALAV